MRARALRAPVFLGSLTHKRGRCAPPPIADSRLLIRKPKLNKKNFRTRAARVKVFTEPWFQAQTVSTMGHIILENLQPLNSFFPTFLAF